jgi:hypothetical protein
MCEALYLYFFQPPVSSLSYVQIFSRHIDVWTHIFLTSALVGGEWSASRRGHFTSGGKSLWYEYKYEKVIVQYVAYCN